MDDYIIDVYHVIDPYNNEYRHLERVRFQDIFKFSEHLKLIQKKYDGVDLPKIGDYVITTCKGDHSADNCIKHVLKQLATMPTKSEIN